MSDAQEGIHTKMRGEIKMKYLEIVKRLQNLNCNLDVLVLVRSGIFFYGVGKDAIILSENLGLNYCCIKKQLCKCAIPIVRIDKIMKILQAKRISFAIYDYVPKGINQIQVAQYKEIARYISLPISENREHFDCSKCQFHNLIDNNAKNSKKRISQILDNIKSKENNNGR